MAHKGIKVERAVKAEKAIWAAKAPMPQAAQPLPIVPPAITFKVLPSYPSAVLEKGRKGMVLLSVYVGLSGQPEKVEVKSSSGVAELDKSATEAVSQWKFSPAIQGGSALASWFEVPVRFEIK
jgi:protein TonB